MTESALRSSFIFIFFTLFPSDFRAFIDGNRINLVASALQWRVRSQPVAVAVADGEEFGEDGDRAGNVAAVDTEEDEAVSHGVDGVDVEEVPDIFFFSTRVTGCGRRQTALKSTLSSKCRPKLSGSEEENELPHMTMFRHRRFQQQLHLRQKAPATPSQSSSPAPNIASPRRQHYPPLPPLLCENFDYWKSRIKAIMRSADEEIWNSCVRGYKLPTKIVDEETVPKLTSELSKKEKAKLINKVNLKLARKYQDVNAELLKLKSQLNKQQGLPFLIIEEMDKLRKEAFDLKEKYEALTELNMVHEGI
ncbi:hypothetical protein RHGRI_001491 [Rhododendron griersonianum]|uniref:Uncharacterized protein n=1 Tax=Rhododendron griersonianum TaxID=479676 RepID=A0AAV6LLF3_9ERIC|nr:hypothetical protein RHGRI_001491 [Rhododendron griersonianum]